jgi:hypothetical protein
MEICGRGVDLARRPDLYELPCLQDADAVRHRHGFDLVVGHVEDGGTQIALDTLQLKPHLGAELGIKRGERLIHEIDRRLSDQRTADGDALHLAAREAGCPALELMIDAHELGGLAHPAIDFGLLEAARRRTQRKGEVFVN